MNWDNDKLAREITEFSETDLGKHFIAWMSGLYSDTHQMAERDDLTNEKVAALIHEAKGVKRVLDHFLTNIELHKQSIQKEEIDK